MNRIDNIPVPCAWLRTNRDNILYKPDHTPEEIILDLLYQTRSGLFNNFVHANKNSDEQFFLSTKFSPIGYVPNLLPSKGPTQYSFENRQNVMISQIMKFLYLVSNEAPNLLIPNNVLLFLTPATDIEVL